MRGVWRTGREFLREVHFLGQSCRNRPAGHTGGLPAVTLPFSYLKWGRKVSGDPPPPALTFFLVHAIIFLENRLLERRCCIC